MLISLIRGEYIGRRMSRIREGYAIMIKPSLVPHIRHIKGNPERHPVIFL